MKEIVLHGALAEFGGPFLLDIATVPEAIRALSQLPGFEEKIRAGIFRISTDRGDIIPEGVGITLGKAKRVDIYPVAAGAKKGGIGKAILGIALIGTAIAFAPAAPAAFGAGAADGVAAAGFAAEAFSVGGLSVTWGNIGLYGATTLLGGLSSMLTPAPAISDFENYKDADEQASFLFNGAVNTTQEGGAIPYVFGRVRIGIIGISAGITAERI